MSKLAQSAIPLIKFHTGNSIPQIGLGTYQMRGAACANAVKTAIKNGYRHLDTASLYQNEADIAKTLEELYAEKVVTREDLFITSKIPPSNHGYDKTLAVCDATLKKLNTSYLNLLLILWPGANNLDPSSQENAEVRLETWKALEKLKSDGKVKDIGVSNFLVNHLEHLMCLSKTKPVVNQLEIHPFCYNKELIDFCKQNDVVVEAYSPLARNQEILTKNETIMEIAKKHKKTVAQVVLKWGLQNGFVVIPKSKTEEHIKENIELFDFELSQDEIQKLIGLNKDLHTIWDPSLVKY